jgi:ketosteroid isomerase-like protein
MSDVTEVAPRLFRAIEGGDADAVAACFSADAVVWHNIDRVEQPLAETLKVLRWMARNVTDLRYEDVRCEATASGFVQQHVLRGNAPSGRQLELPACLVATVEGGLITRIDEYVDTKAVDAAFS